MKRTDKKYTTDWEAVYWALLPRIYNFHRYRCGDNQVAQDLTSKTFIRAWRFRDKYNRDLGAFEAWIFTIARNVAIDHLRATKPPTLVLDDLHNLADEYSVEHETLKRLEFANLHRQLAQLPAREQEIIALKFGASMTNRAIAQALDLSESNVGTILNRTLRMLREQLESEYGR